MILGMGVECGIGWLGNRVMRRIAKIPRTGRNRVRTLAR